MMYHLSRETDLQSDPSIGEQLLPGSTLQPSAIWLGLGGALFVTTYALEIVFGMQYGREHTAADVATLPLAWVILFSLTLSLLVAAIGKFQLARALRSLAPRTALGGMALTGVAFVLMPINLVSLSGIFGAPQHNPGLMQPILTNLAATALIGLVMLRRRLAPRPVAMTLLAVGAGTFPFILLTIPLEAIIPTYVIADLPFAVWGAALIMVSWMLQRSVRQ